MSLEPVKNSGLPDADVIGCRYLDTCIAHERPAGYEFSGMDYDSLRKRCERSQRGCLETNCPIMGINDEIYGIGVD